MPTPRQKPLRSALDLFLLVLLDQGISSIYELREEAGLSVGATQPALARLKKESLVAMRQHDSRGKISYALTAKGRAVLDGQWRSLVEHSPAKPLADTATVLRLVVIAMELGGGSEAASLLRRAEEDRLRKAKDAGGRRKRRSGGAQSFTSRYRTVANLMEAAQYKAEANAFAGLVAFISEGKPKRKK